MTRLNRVGTQAAASIDSCFAEVQSDGTVFYQAFVESPDEGQPQGEVEWFINGILAARDGPLALPSSGGLNDFHQPREEGFTENELLEFATESDLLDFFGPGTHDVTAELTIL